jgi:exosortase E/protease (VPEID-CTERM system)
VRAPAPPRAAGAPRPEHLDRSIGPDAPPGAPGLGASWILVRLALPFALVAIEFAILSLGLDMPARGPAQGLAEAVRIAVPVVLGAAIGGYLVGRRRGAIELQHFPPLPPWRPVPALLLQPLAFAATSMLAVRLLGAGRPSPGVAALALLLLAALATALVALAVAAPPGWWLGLVSRRWRGALLAVALGALSWRAAAMAEELWGSLSWSTLQGSAWLLRHWGTVTLDAPAGVLGLNGFEVEIAAACSGVSGLGLVVTFLAVWVALAQERMYTERALLLLPLGAVLAHAANVVRIVALVRVGAGGGQALALGGFHSKLGWALFAGVALGVVALAERVPWFRRPQAPAADGPIDTTGLLPLLATLAAGLASGIAAEGPFDLWYGLRVVAGAAALAALRRRLPELRPSRAAWPALVGLAVGFCWVALVSGGVGPRAGLAALSPAARAAWIAVRALGSILVLPLVEELAFRGFLLGWLGRSPAGEPPRPLRAWPLGAVVVSSAAFGAIHGAWLAATLAGLAFAAVRLARGRLGDAVVAHAAANAVVAAAALLGGRWDLW